MAGMMKFIIAVIKPLKLDAVVDALKCAGAGSFAGMHQAAIASDLPVRLLELRRRHGALHPVSGVRLDAPPHHA
jgi:hypothetical protein